MWRYLAKHVVGETRVGCVRCRTPEYMSPELLHNGQDGTDQAYDPRSTDVWAAGVMLVVALCGAFPFDHTQHHHRSMEEAELDLWYELTNSLRGVCMCVRCLLSLGKHAMFCYAYSCSHHIAAERKPARDESPHAWTICTCVA